MSYVTAFAFTEPFTPGAVIVDAARCWRDAMDRQRPVLPTLFARLEIGGAGFLAPAIAALLQIHEAWSGRRFGAGEHAALTLTEDERDLLGLLEAAAPPAASSPSRPSLTGTLRIALRSTRILVLQVLGRDLGEGCEAPGIAVDTPIFFACANDVAQPSHNQQPATKTQDAV